MAIPSMVLSSRPSAWTASIVHDLALSPSTWTVQAPQLLVSQPTCVPVSPRLSRRKWTSRRRGSTSASWAVAVDGDRDVLGAHRRRASYAYASARSVARRSALRVSSATIARLYSTGPRTSPRGSALGRRRRHRPARKRSSDGALPARTASASVAANGRLGDPGQADPGALDAAVGAEPDDRRDTDRREVADLALELLVRAAGAARLGAGRGSRSGPRSARWRSGRCRGRSRAPRSTARRSGSGRRSWRSAAMRTAGQSEAGSAWATEPPIVPQLRTCGSPIVAVTSWSSG